MFQHQGTQERWLYVATQGSWWVGTFESMKRQLARGCICSEAQSAGALPHEVPTWEVALAGQWTRHAGMHFFLPQSVEVAWQQTIVQVAQVPVVDVSGVVDKSAEGLYDFVPGKNGNVGQPPAFQHQQRPNLWLFFAADLRWWIGNEKAKEQHDAVGLAHSAMVQPGTHPASACGWHARNAKVWEECPALQVQAASGALRAQDRWGQVICETPLEIWGTDLCHGTCLLCQGREMEPPTYRISGGDLELWLYMAMDGCWWISTTTCKDEGKAHGFLRSDVVEPGTLPQHVDRWLEFGNGSWQLRPMACVMLSEAVHQQWVAVRGMAEKQPVIEVSAVEGQQFEGLYDLIADEQAMHGAPVYQHQVNRKLFLYVADDGRWWVGRETAMRQRKGGASRMCSDSIRPGTLPFRTGLTWHVFNDKSKEWKKQDCIVIS